MNLAEYSRIDKLLHRIAFRGQKLQVLTGEFENDIFSRKLRFASAAKPVFITSLPRAGTTLLLEMMSTVPGFASHTYRDMPFVLCPILWSNFASRFPRTSVERPRAHGDGMVIGLDSPEAFDEVAWQAFWPRKYLAERILPWTRDDKSPGFKRFFTDHMKKIVHLRLENHAETGRYVSKNNTNIARIDLLSRLFPDCTIVVMFRNPIAQSESLLRQHLNFLRIHAAEPFAAEYMKGIGHLDFGLGFRPIDFGQRIEANLQETHTLGYWVNYWTHAFRWVLQRSRENVVFCGYEECCRDPVRVLSALAERLEFDPTQLVRLAGRFRQFPNRTEGAETIECGLLADAQTVYENLTAVQIGK